MNLSSKQAAILIGGIVLVLIVGALMFFNLRSANTPPDVELTIWGTEPAGSLEPVLESYRQFRQNVTISYQEITSNSYYERLLEALASGNGPDVFMINNRWLPMTANKLSPAAANQMTVAQVRELFPSAVEQDFVSNGSVYALPLNFDTLALFYNKEAFDEAGLVSAPKTWDEFQATIPRLKMQNQNQQLVRAAAAIGATDRTVNAGTDTLELLMMQSLWQEGIQMLDQNGIHFYTNDRGKEAFKFYLQFANPGSTSYTWSETQRPALDSFASGQVAMVFGYERDLERLTEKSPFLSLRVAPVPQVKDGRNVNLANYTGFGVSKQSPVAAWGWDFVLYATTQPSVNQAYLATSGRLPALKSLIQTGTQDLDKSPFYAQALTARSWYNPNAFGVKRVLNDAITNVLTGQADAMTALQQAEIRIEQMLQ